MEHGRSTVESSLTREINELKGIIGELTIANETLKKNSTYKERWEAKNDLVSNGIPKSRSQTQLDYYANNTLVESSIDRITDTNCDVIVVVAIK